MATPSRFNRPYAELPPPGENTTVMSNAGSLANRGAVPMGRPGSDPQRRLDMLGRRAWTRGDEGAVLGITGQQLSLQQAQVNRDFTAGRDAANFDRGVMMFGLHQQAQNQRDEKMRTWQESDAAAESAARQKEMEDRRQQELMMFGLNQGAQAMEQERKRQQEEADRNRQPNVQTVALPGTNYAIAAADGRPMGTVPVKQPDKPLPPGMVPEEVLRDGVRYGRPQTAKTQRPQIQMMKNANGVDEPHQVVVGEDGSVTLKKIKVIDANGDGIPDNKQLGGGNQGSLSTRPAQSTTTPSRFGSEIQRLMGGGR